MRRRRFCEPQILKIIKEFESGLSVQEHGRKYGFLQKQQIEKSRYYLNQPLYNLFAPRL
jgi:hypothetical protein